MRKLTSFFAIAFVACGLAHAATDAPEFDAARAGVRGAPVVQPAGSATPQRGAPAATPAPAQATATGRGTGPGQPAPAATTGGRSATVQPRGVAQRQPAAEAGRSAAAPAAARTAVPQSQSVSRAATQIPTAGAVRAAPTSARSASASRAAVPGAATGGAARTARSAAPARSAQSRSATVQQTPASIAEMGAGYRACRETYFDCMDELCANKDSQLRRCACSSRVREFDAQRRDLDNFSEKVQDFNANLLTVAMDKEDAEAIRQATEGEDAYHGTKDRSDAQKILDEIMGKLRGTNESESISRSLSAINLSMDYSDPFDSVDMTLGANMTAKEGDALYQAARPVCREMAAEVCAPADINTVTSAYQMAIEQDCNAVQKAYAGLADRARETVFEAGALLDIARLQNFQGRNADDILTCRRKMMEMLSDPAVCGTNLEKCLDWSGRYVDPLTGAPILSADLYRLGETITRPAGDQMWAKVPGNERFVAFLNSKKKFIEPAMKQCEKIADQAWGVFIEDALAQIRIQQGRKLEEMRQACTGVTTQCLTDATKSFQDFDARAISIFGIHTDKAAKAICEEVMGACTALMAAPPMDTELDGEGIWADGMTMIALQKTYEQIMQTCTQVGQNCIVQNCTNLAGKFGLCGFDPAHPQLNRPRLNIIGRKLCWPEVLKCVNDAGGPTLERIINANLVANLPEDTQGGYRIFRLCSSDDNACSIAERIWGNCTENHMTGSLNDSDPPIWDGARIRDDVPVGRQSLLAWFAKNTGGTDSAGTGVMAGIMGGNGGICFGNECPPGTTTVAIAHTPTWATGASCPSNSDITSDNTYCPSNEGIGAGWPGNQPIFQVTSEWTNCCETGQADSFGNCCAENNKAYCVSVDVTNSTATMETNKWYNNPVPDNTNCASKICLPENQSAQLLASYNRIKDINTDYVVYLFCVGEMENATPSDLLNNGIQSKCDGHLMEVNPLNGMYSAPGASYTVKESNDLIKIASYYYATNRKVCLLKFNPADNNSWSQTKGCDKVPNPPTKTTSTKLFMGIGPISADD
ncbi:MAG: hypothetical protein FWG39_03795 [Alphaproteobacteria bacterium]|nr:hypothetical protein [Alphaproteobacteria bacterium]